MANRNVIATLPNDLTDEIALRKFLTQLAEKVEVAFSARSSTVASATVADVTAQLGASSIVGISAETDTAGLADRIKDLEQRVSDLE